MSRRAGGGGGGGAGRDTENRTSFGSSVFGGGGGAGGGEFLSMSRYDLSIVASVRCFFACCLRQTGVRNEF